jgi:hypothetical protein
MPSVVLGSINLAAFVILLPIDLRVFLRRQLAAVGRAIRPDFVVNGRLLMLYLCGFMRGHGTVGHTVRNPLLLALLAFIDFVFSKCGSGRGDEHGTHHQPRYEMFACHCFTLRFIPSWFLSCEARLDFVPASK